MEYDKLVAVAIDDNQQNLMLLDAYAHEVGLNLQTFLNPVEALGYIMHHEIDIIFVDYMMPQLDGIELIKRFRKKNTLTPVVMVTAAGDLDIKYKSLESGATDFLTKPVDLVEFKARTRNLINLRLAQLKLQDEAVLLKDEVAKATETLRESEYETLDLLGKTAEFRDPETGNHINRVAHYTKIIAKRIGMNEESQNILFHASPFHDIGKIGIPDSILLKPARLTEKEFSIMKKHPVIGYKILKNRKSKFLQAGAIISLTHHEKYDGTGYPQGIIKDKIPLPGRIVAVADVFDALTSKRPYKDAWPLDVAIDFLIEERGKHLDPNIVNAFLKEIKQVKDIFYRLIDD